MNSITRLAAALGAVALGLASGPAWTASPHFISSQSELNLNADGSLTCSWKEAGLGDNALIEYECRGDATATYACQNGGGNFPQAANKQDVAGPVSAFGAFQSGKNGQITASLTLQPPPSTLDCPSGQVEVLCAVSYSNVEVEDLTNMVVEPLGARSGVLVPGCPG